MPKDNLSGKKLDHMNLSGTNVSESDLSKASLRRSQLKGAKLHNANLADSDLRGAHLEHADLSGADLRGVDLGRTASIEGAKLAGAKGVSPETVEQVADDRVMSVQWAEEAEEWTVRGRLQVAPMIQRLLAALTDPAWVAEPSETHVLRPLQESATAEGSPWTLEETEIGDEALIVNVIWERPETTMRRLRADVFGLIGTIAETVTFGEQARTDQAMEFRIATGMLAEDGPLAAHGHLILLRVGGPAVRRLLARG